MQLQCHMTLEQQIPHYCPSSIKLKKDTFNRLVKAAVDRPATIAIIRDIDVI